MFLFRLVVHRAWEDHAAGSATATEEGEGELSKENVLLTARQLDELYCFRSRSGVDDQTIDSIRTYMLSKLFKHGKMFHTNIQNTRAFKGIKKPKAINEDNEARSCPLASIQGAKCIACHIICTSCNCKACESSVEHL